MTNYLKFKIENLKYLFFILFFLINTKSVLANFTFAPTGNGLVVGRTMPVTTQTAAATEGTNLGSWKALLADDNFHLGIGATSTGINFYIDMDGVAENGANTIILQTEFDLDATAPNTLVQICDWSSSTGVDNAADSQCTGGGWRTLNNRNTAITTATPTAYQWNIHNGLWNTATPISNFINTASNNKIRVRFFATNSTTSVIHVDYVRTIVVINPLYTPAGFTNLGSGATVGTFREVNSVTQGASDNQYNGAAGTAGSIADFYWTFGNIKTHPSMNTILVRAEYSCSAINAGITYRPKIFNFSNSAWEDLSTGSITCTTTDVTNAWAKSNIAVADYIDSSTNQIRVGLYSLVNTTLTIRSDFIYIMLGTVNSDSSQCELSMGTNNGGDCSATRDLDMTPSTGVGNTWSFLAEDESTAISSDYYPFDTDGDAANNEEASAAHIKYDVARPIDGIITGALFAARFASGAAGATVQLGLRDYSGSNSTTGGFSAYGATNASATLGYTDNITVGTVTNGGMAGYYDNAEDYLLTTKREMWSRLRTSTDNGSAQNTISSWDFSMIALQWVEDLTHVSKTYQFAPTANGLVVGNTLAITAQTAATTEGVNIGSWKGTLADDNFHWGFSSTTSGFNAYLDLDYVQLNGANSILIQTELDLDATLPGVLIQICDWTSSTGVDSVADGQCTTGGWRTLNNRNVVISTATPTAYHWQIYDGYWNSSTPLLNFVNKTSGSNKIRVRYFSTTNTTSAVYVDFLRVNAVVSPVYTASSFVNLGSGTTAGTFRNTTAYGQGGSDNTYITTAGTVGSVADFYLGFNNIKTYSGMNTILVRAEHSCSVTNAGQGYRPKIYNFNSSTWEDLVSADITCSTTDATNVWAKNNISIANYISNGQIRVGFRGTSNYTTAIRVDLMYIIIGTTNSDSAMCEISYGTGVATDCSATRNLSTTDAVGVGTSWNITTQDESATDTALPYALTYDGDATLEEAASSNVRVGISVPDYASPVAVYSAFRMRGGTAGTVSVRLRDYSGAISNTGGFSAISAAATATTALNYFDNISLGGVGSGGWGGFSANPTRFVDEDDNEVWMQLVTTVDGTTANNSVASWDFAFSAIAWIEPEYTVVGNIFSDEGVTPYDCSVDNLTLSLRVNGGSSFSGTCSEGSGLYVITDIGSTNSGDVLTVYVDNETPKANVVTRSHGKARAIRDLDVYQNRVVLRHEDAGPISNSNLSQYDSDDDSDVRFSANSGNLISSLKLVLGAGESYTPSGNVDVPSFEVLGSFSLANNSLTLRSGGGGISCSAEDGLMMPLCPSGIGLSASFNTGTVNYESQVGTTIYTTDYNNLGVGTSSENGVGTTFFVVGNIDIAGTLTIGGETSTNNDILNILTNSLTLRQGNIAAIRNIGNLAGNGSVDYVSNVGVSLAAFNYFNLGVGISAESGVGATYVVGAGTTVNNNLTIGNVSSTNTDILSGGSGSLILMQSGNPWVNMTNKGDFAPATGTVSYQAISNTDIRRMSYYNLDISPISGNISFGFSGIGDVTVANDLTIGGVGNVSLDVETLDPNIDIDNNLSVGSGDSFLASSTASLSVGQNIDIGGTFTRNNSTVTLDTSSKTSLITSGVGVSFYNLTVGVTGKTIRFDANETTVIANSFLVNSGTSCSNPVLLYSEADGNSWDFRVLGTNTVNYAQIKDGNALSALIANNSVNAGNNTGWTINSGPCNTAPNDPTVLAQKKTDGTNLSTGAWVSGDTIRFEASASDSNAADNLQLCVEKKALGVSFVNTEDFCGDLVAYSGSPVGVAVTIPTQSEGEYHWQARIKDSGGLYSNWISFGANLESERDYGLDTSAPMGGTVFDGDQTGIDLNYNSGGLDSLYANWSGINANISGLSNVEFAVGTGVGTSNIVGWTGVGTGSSGVASGLSLNTSDRYYFVIRASDYAGNIGNTVVSDGLSVAPTLNFSATPSEVNFSNLNSGNNYTSTANTTLTVSTNAYNGYVIRAYLTSLLRSGDLLHTINNFNGGSYASPDGWQTGDLGFGYNSSDNTISGVNIFNNSPCPGGNSPPCYAPFSITAPGDIVADHTNQISGSPVSNETFTISYRVSTSNIQAAANYTTTIIYTIVPQY